MDAVERDDFVHALGQTLAFYGKDLDKMQTSFWVTACNGRPVKKLKAALLDYVRVGKYAPKPADILAIIDQQPKGEAKALPPPKQETSCPPEVAKAWMWFLNRITEDSKNLSGLFDSNGSYTLDEQEKFLHIVNHEAHKYSTPDAIPGEYKLKEVWG